MLKLGHKTFGNHLSRTFVYAYNKISRNLCSCLNKSGSGETKTFNTPHPPKDPPDDYNPDCVGHQGIPPPPEGVSAWVFRQFQTNDEKLGPGADKCGVYKNSEYYGYHRYSNVNLFVDTLKLREMQECAKEDTQTNQEETAQDCKEDTSSSSTSSSCSSSSDSDSDGCNDGEKN